MKTKRQYNRHPDALRPPGRPPGYQPPPTRVITHEQGAWAWNAAKIEEKLVKGSKTACWAWQGATSPGGNLLGAYKNGHAQMTQVNRLIAMQELNVDLEGQQVRMRCGNKKCSNWHHFLIEPIVKRKHV